jgi:hypothetical protein
MHIPGLPAIDGTFPVLSPFLHDGLDAFIDGPGCLECPKVLLGQGEGVIFKQKLVPQLLVEEKVFLSPRSSH